MTGRIDAEHVRLKRAYEPTSPADGRRVLVDRLWPRGVTKAKAAIDLWMKDIAPTTELRQWFGHDPARWDDFRRRYIEQIRRQPDLLDALRGAAREGPLTLIYAAHDEAHNDAVVLREVILEEP
ncbi:MAG: DUF488 domain-containing protein [Phenylobacterium sp.]